MREAEEDEMNIRYNKMGKYKRKDAGPVLVKKKPAETGLILAL